MRSSGVKRKAGRRYRCVNASVGLQTSDIVKKKKSPTNLSVFRCRPRVDDCVCQGIRRQRWLQLLFWGLGWRGRASATQETVLKVGRRKGNGWTMNLWFCLATKGGVQRKRDQSASAFRAEASCRSPVSLAKNKPWVEMRGFLPSYLSASFSRLFHHPALLPFPAAEPQSKASQSGGLTFAAHGRKIPPKHKHICPVMNKVPPIQVVLYFLSILWWC